MKTSFSVFTFMIHAFGVKAECAPDPMRHSQLPIYETSLVKSKILKAALCVLGFTILALTFRSLIHLKLTLCVVWVRVQLYSLACNSASVQHCLVRRLFFSP